MDDRESATIGAELVTLWRLPGRNFGSWKVFLTESSMVWKME